jgi:hypothetical protein
MPIAPQEQRSPPVLEPEPGRPQDRLTSFLGRWRAEGYLGDGDRRVEAAAALDFEWVPGQYFLHQRSVLSSHRDRASISIFGFDESSQRYHMHLFDDRGHERLYEGLVQGDQWRFQGLDERVTYTFDPEGEQLVIRWERRMESGWIDVCNLKATREH